jgi:DNA polymerase V
LRTSRFCDDAERYSCDKTETLNVPTDDSRTIITLAKLMIEDLFVRGYRYTKCGIVLMNLVDGQCVQQDMFVKKTTASHKYLMKTIDNINRKHGKASLVFAAEGLVKPWIMKSGARTPRYTTHWQELARVH